jgi:hypothetical protein
MNMYGLFDFSEGASSDGSSDVFWWVLDGIAAEF